MTAPRPSFAADHPASERQRQAADPRASTWLSANAGSGKTHVLTQRVIKLLLRGEDPGRILCITFTKAAAATMATRSAIELGLLTATRSRSTRGSESAGTRACASSSPSATPSSRRPTACDRFQR